MRKLTFGVTLLGLASLTQVATAEVTPEEALVKLEIELPQVSEPVGIYRRAVIVDDLVYLSGHIPIDVHGNVIAGKVGADMDIAAAQQAARRCGLAMLATLRSELGTLDRVKRLVKTTGMVNCAANFTEQPSVVNGCSQLFVDVFGKDNGIGARAAVGMSALPKGAVVEIEAVFEIER